MLNWRLEKRKLRELVPNDRNPRELSKMQEGHLRKSLEKYGLIDKPIVQGNKVIGGHQRINVMISMGISECDCWIADDEISQADIDELMIRLNRNHGEWDFDILANEFDMQMLFDWGFTEDELTECAPKKLPKPKITIEFDDRDEMALSLEMISKLGLNAKIKVSK
ncbi:MAG TPA: ParB N-terminal domain-containing protein [Nitrososphaeraceae archaeon]|nr:ParB N-terminal domain-containing protein [Nitrososphaeraceae archaeon]